MRVVGIDPGLARTGVSVVDGTPGHLSLIHASCLTTVPQTNDAMRLVNLAALLADILSTYRPDVAAVEQLFFATNQKTALAVSEARGVLRYSVAITGVPIAEYTPLQVKEAVAGHGGARKQQVARMVCQLLKTDAIAGPDDVTDACAIAICHHHRAALSIDIRGHRTMSPRLAAAVARATAPR